jgi:hypothetical protein
MEEDICRRRCREEIFVSFFLGRKGAGGGAEATPSADETPREVDGDLKVARTAQMHMRKG